MFLSEDELRALRDVDLSMSIPAKLVPGRRFLDIKYYSPEENDTEEDILENRKKASLMQGSDQLMITNVIAATSPFSAFDGAKNLVMLSIVDESGARKRSMWVPIHWVHHPKKHRNLMHRAHPFNRKHEPL